jgi:hypothetical protein
LAQSRFTLKNAALVQMLTAEAATTVLAEVAGAEEIVVLATKAGVAYSVMLGVAASLRVGVEVISHPRVVASHRRHKLAGHLYAPTLILTTHQHQLFKQFSVPVNAVKFCFL